MNNSQSTFSPVHKCPVCGKVFSSKRGLAQHGQAKHGWTKPQRRNRSNDQPTGGKGLVPRGNPGNTMGNKKRVDQIDLITTPNWGYCEKVFKKLISVGCTLDGAAHVVHAVDPACPEGIPWNGIPDENTTRILSRRIISINTITKAHSAVGNWDFALMTCWSPHAEFVWFQQKTGGDWSGATQGQHWDCKLSRFSRLDWQSVTRFRQAFGSTTIHMDASATTTEGTVYSMQKSPERYLENEYKSGLVNKTVNKPIATVKIEHDSDSDDSWISAPTTSTATKSKVVSPTGADEVTARLLCEYCGKWTQADMAFMDPGFYTAEAFKGVYSVCRLAGPRVWSVGSWQDEGGVDRWRVVAPLGTHHDFAKSKSPLVSNDIFQPFTNGWVIFTNLDPKAQLVIKTVRGYEMEVNSESIAALDTHFSPDSDPLALHFETQLLRGLQSGGPASDNDFGDILSGALDVLLDGLTATGGPVGAVLGPAGKLLKKTFWR
ncbi:hypothetical protein 3 [Beihai tombus-like virus 9]|uniref:hypothetical protein 3 n=1 Tax=Beihai tombus-like virus 9 TaxID=1922730 RepID=UPI00090B9881|nr:hypothetical protein 3 [Beihai tombus-like virus 9]APG76192.1 hypothetical protein 3 [Beihai tombus-like virus 9]